MNDVELIKFIVQKIEDEKYSSEDRALQIYQMLLLELEGALSKIINARDGKK